MGWFSKIEQPLVRDASIGLWRLFSDLDLSEAKKTQVHAACTTASPASSRTARGRSIPIPRSWSAPATPSSARAGGSQAPSCFRSRAFPTRLQDLLGDAGAGRAPPQRPLRHAAADLEHVSPLPRAARLPGRAGHLHLRRHLERQSDRAEADREAVLQERARGHRDAAGGDRRPRSRWCRSPPSWWPASGCIAWTCRSISSIAAATSSAARPPIGRARRWAGSSTARPSSCWRRGRLSLAEQRPDRNDDSAGPSLDAPA